MGEIMRWRVTRAPQRRVSPGQSTLHLDQTFKTTSSANNKLTNLPKAHSHSQNPHNPQNPPSSSLAAYDFYLSILSDTNALRLYLTTGSATGGPSNTTPANNAAAALLQLDDWLAANAPVPPTAAPYNTPAVADLVQQISSLLGTYLPNSNGWKTLHQMLAELLYAGLILSALGGDFSLVDALGLLTRWLLVVGLVDDLQHAQSAIQTPDDIYAALRWRTIVLPDNIVSMLLSIRASQNAVLVRKPGFADLYITREEWDHYEAAEIASIENILGRELKSRVHVLVNQTKTSVTTDQTTTTLSEQDTTTTDLSQMQQQSSSDIALAAHVDGQVNVSAQYGTVSLNAHVGGSLDFSDSSATSKATTQSHETVARAVTRIEQTTRQIRTVSTMTRSTDREEHKFDNTQQPQPVVGVYRWVDQIQNIELDRYPHRFLMEFEIPEPGAWTRWLHLNDAADGMINQPPVPFTLNGAPVSSANPPLNATDINATNYASLAARYMATGFDPIPADHKAVAVNIGFPASGTATNQGSDYVYQADSSVSVPNGYVATVWAATALMTDANNPNNEPSWIDIDVGGGYPPHRINSSGSDFGSIGPPPGGPVGPTLTGNIPVSVQAHNIFGFEVDVYVTCVPLPATIAQWQSDTYAIIVGAYNNLLQAYNNERSGLSDQKTNLVDANSPDQNANTIKQELKRQVIEMLIGTPFPGLSAINWDPSGVKAPTTTLSEAAQIAPEIQFLEQAFEWETLTYICYPYYWADASRWAELSDIKGSDSNFADFLRSGSARVVLAARPGFEDQVNFYVKFGILWGGGPMPAPGDPDYLSIADEIKAMQEGPLDVTVIDTWQVRLPTTLIWLENPDGLPKNPSPTIDVTPNISDVSPDSGKVGDTIVISGTNFGDIRGVSSVSFNGTLATPTGWSATSISVTVPHGATTGKVVVTVGGMASNGFDFTVL